MRKTIKYWKVCPTCFKLVFSSGVGTGNHICPEPMVAKREAELDMEVDETMENWNDDLEIFWNSKDVKFIDYLARKGKL